MKQTIEMLEERIRKLQLRVFKLKEKEAQELQAKCLHTKLTSRTIDDWHSNGIYAVILTKCNDCGKVSMEKANPNG